MTLGVIRAIQFSQMSINTRLATSWRAELCDAGQMKRVIREYKQQAPLSAGSQISPLPVIQFKGNRFSAIIILCLQLNGFALYYTYYYINARTLQRVAKS